MISSIPLCSRLSTAGSGYLCANRNEVKIKIKMIEIENLEYKEESITLLKIIPFNNLFTWKVLLEQVEIFYPAFLGS